ncbi:hypothetical protein Bca4012_025514 [Brassica carinata]
MWRALSGELAVRQRLSTRGIALNTTCMRCGLQEETICHTLFHCKPARETWKRSGFPLPPAGFSHNLVFLNFHYLIAESRKHTTHVDTRRRFPWILWQIWKARNTFCFEHTCVDAESIFNKAEEDSSSWFHAQTEQSDDQRNSRRGAPLVERWKSPPPNMIKCNVGASWDGDNMRSGASWIKRDHLGHAIAHSHRAYSGVRSLIEAELLSLLWTVESMKNLCVKRIIFEVSSPDVYELLTNSRRIYRSSLVLNNIRALLHNAGNYHIMCVHHSLNKVASEIAASVTRDCRLQSYVATGGPSWLNSLIISEAAANVQEQGT